MELDAYAWSHSLLSNQSLCVERDYLQNATQYAAEELSLRGHALAIHAVQRFVLFNYSRSLSRFALTQQRNYTYNNVVGVSVTAAIAAERAATRALQIRQAILLRNVVRTHMGFAASFVCFLPSLREHHAAYFTTIRVPMSGHRYHSSKAVAF